MSKLVIILVIVAATVISNAESKPEASFLDLSSLFNGFPSFGSFFNSIGFPSKPVPVANPDEIRNLKGDDGTQVYGSYQSSSSSFKSVNGVPVEDTQSGLKITNNNGNIDEEKL